MPQVETVTGQQVELDDYDPLCVFRGWVANAQPNLRSGTFRILFDTEGSSPLPHADLINAYGEMLVIQVYRMRLTPIDPQLVDELVEMEAAGALEHEPPH